MKLTEINVPFGELDAKTQRCLKRAYARGRVIEVKMPDRLDFKFAFIGTPFPDWCEDLIYRVKPGSRNPNKPRIPWRWLTDEIEWVAMNEDGEWCTFKDKPSCSFGLWLTPTGFSCAFPMKLPTVPDWKKSLQRRPKKFKNGTKP